MIGSKLLIVIAALISFLFCGCNQSQRQLSGGYYLERFDEGGPSYYVDAPGKPLDGGGVFDGAVQEIGWNKEWILARVTRLYQGDSNGWYVLNIKTGQVTGPIPDDQIKTNSGIKTIKTEPVAAVFVRSQ
jgi:hypothetical protein